MKKVGGNLSINSVLHLLRIDIVDDVVRDPRSGKTPATPRYRVNLTEVPAFQLTQFTANVAMRDEFDKEIRPVPQSTDMSKNSKHAITVAMKNLDAKPTTTKVCYIHSLHSLQF